MPIRVRALVMLAWALVRSFFRRLWATPGAGFAAFRRNFDAEGLKRILPEERVALGTFSGCIACGACDRGEAERIERSEGAYRGVMALVLSASRSMPDFELTRRALQHVSEDVLAEKEQLCPTRVPIRQIARFVNEHGRDTTG